MAADPRIIEQLRNLLAGGVSDISPYQYAASVGADGPTMATGYRSPALDQALAGMGYGYQITPIEQQPGSVYDPNSPNYTVRLHFDDGDYFVPIGPGGAAGDARYKTNSGGNFLERTVGENIGWLGPLLVGGAAALGGGAFGAAGGASGSTAGAPISASSPSWVAGIGSTAGMTPAQIAGAEGLLGAGGAAAGGSGVLSALRQWGPTAMMAGGLAAGGGGLPAQPPPTDHQAELDAAIKGINDLFATDKRSPVYQQVYDDVYGLQSSRLNENREDTLRKLRFGLARTGLTGGSAAVGAHGTEQREFGRALSDASNVAQGASDEVRSNDERTRLNLIAQMRSGLDSADATQSALTQMADNANAARSGLRYDALDSYMGAITPTIDNLQIRSGRQAANTLYNERYPQNRVSLSGRSGQIVG